MPSASVTTTTPLEGAFSPLGTVIDTCSNSWGVSKPIGISIGEVSDTTSFDSIVVVEVLSTNRFFISPFISF